MRVFHGTQHSGYHSTQFPSNVLRVATYNIHKGVRGVGPRRRLEIHNLVLGIEALDADFVFLQEVRRMNHAAARHFPDTKIGWPKVPQADYLAPEGYDVAYVTNAVTRDGEHGNALLSRWPIGDIGHHDVSDHRFEQRGLLHAEVRVHRRPVHVLVVHLGLIKGSRVRQLAQVQRFIAREIPVDAPLVVAGDFNDWGRTVQGALGEAGLAAFGSERQPTFPSRLPLVQLDHVYARGMEPLGLYVPRGRIWGQMSDHLPLIAEFDLPVDEM